MASAAITTMSEKQKQDVEKTVRKEQGRLLAFIRNRVSDRQDAEDILQDVFVQFVNGYQAIESLEKATSWLFQVARNKIIDKYRKKKPLSFSDVQLTNNQNGEPPILLEDILPDLANNPEQDYFKEVIWEKIEEALSELPIEQRRVFEAHEFEGKSFQLLQDELHVSMNTLLSRKRYAILHLRKRLNELYQELITE